MEAQNQLDEHKMLPPPDIARATVEGTELRPGDDMAEMNATVPRVADEDDEDEDQ